jgi:3-methylcrotonyl-CoA carboxylase alpha subunit
LFDTLLIANRGEIACRVMETARHMGIRSVAVFSDADANARHVSKADEAHHIGPSAVGKSYLDADKVLAAAKASGARAVHPGYGFLSENAAFAEACEAAGIIFVGPPPSAIRAMGEKHAAKALMVASDVPVVPGYHEEDQDDAVLKKAADEIGYPVLIKATSGGGGKGMRRVNSSDEFADALAGARREGKNSFGDDRVLIEKYLEIPRHIEVQVFADNHGNAVYLFERDCSLQRRHQKVIEEAPAPDLSPAIRKAMGEAAVKAALAIGYRGAGTIEFIVDVSNGLTDAPFYFMEMNTRLQVEHPVTELITGVDLVEWQLRVAAGEALPMQQEELSITGHALEVRIYAENPDKGFLPSTGKLKRLRFPAAGPHVRIDTGVEEGDEVTPYYDPMIAKLIVWDEDRTRALRRLRGALQQTEVVGVKTNTAFLARIAVNEDFAAADLDTGFIERHIAELVPEPGATPVRALAIAALAVLLDRADEAVFNAHGNGDPTSPWHQVHGWRMNDDGHDEIKLVVAEEVTAIPVRYVAGGYELTIADQALQVNGELEDEDRIVANIDGVRIVATVLLDGGGVTVIDAGHVHQIDIFDVLAAAEVDDAGTGGVVAPLPGKVVAVLTEAGASVDKGTPLMIVEAMKMEHTITAPADGIVDEIHFEIGDAVDEGTVLVAFSVAED